MLYYQQQQAEIDPYIWMEWEGSWTYNYPEVPDTYLSSVFSSCSLGTDQIGNTTQLPPRSQETDYQDGQQVSEGLSDSQYLLHSQDQTFFADDNIAQAEWSWPEPSQVWLQQDGHEMEQGTLMEDSNLDPRLVNPGAGFSYAPTIGYTMTSDYSGCPKWDDQDLGIQTSSRGDQVKKGKVHIVHVTKPVLTEGVKCHEPWSTGNKRKSKRSSHSAKACTVKRVHGTEFSGQPRQHSGSPSHANHQRCGCLSWMCHKHSQISYEKDG